LAVLLEKLQILNEEVTGSNVEFTILVDFLNRIQKLQNDITQLQNDLYRFDYGFGSVSADRLSQLVESLINDWAFYKSGSTTTIETTSNILIISENLFFSLIKILIAQTTQAIRTDLIQILEQMKIELGQLNDEINSFIGDPSVLQDFLSRAQQLLSSIQQLEDILNNNSGGSYDDQVTQLSGLLNDFRNQWEAYKMATTTTTETTSSLFIYFAFL
jgi:conjugal transfer/entry exclusion protein